MKNNVNIFAEFTNYTVSELEELLNQAKNREEELFYQRVLTLKLGLAQEDVVGVKLL